MESEVNTAPSASKTKVQRNETSSRAGEPADDYGFLYHQLLYCISHDRTIGSVPVAAIYEVLSPAVTRAEQIRAFLEAMLLYVTDTASRQKYETTARRRDSR